MGTRLRSFGGDTRLRLGRGAARRLLALGALLGLLAALGLSLAPAAADGHPADLQLALSLADDSDNIVPPGGEFTVNAELRFSQPLAPTRRLILRATNSVLRLSGYLTWDGPTWHRNDIAQQFVAGGDPALTAVSPTGAALPSRSEMTAKAFDGRTLVARSAFHGQGPNNLYIFDAWNKRQAAIIEPPAGAAGQTFGKGQGERNWNPKSIAVWHETDETAWLFVGSGWDAVEGTNLVGQLWIYRLNWAADPLEVTQVGKIAPPPSEFNNKQSGGVAAYATGVVISRDGSTLAVSSNEINNIGAVYVYSRPDGAGQNWGDLKHADGVKVTPVATPSWGTSTMRPFTPTSTGRTGAATDCDAYCSRVSAQTAGGAGRSDFLWAIALSADGSVLALGAKGKRYASDTPGGSFSGGTANAGEAYIFLAPNGDWRTTPEVSGTLIPALTDATAFDPATHYSPGPARRVTEPAAVLLARPWASAVADQQFGHEVYISHDGTTVAVAAPTGPVAQQQVHIFQRASAAAWAGAGEVLPSASLAKGDQTAISRGGLAISGDGSEVLVGDVVHSGSVGRILVYSRPADGQWTGTFAVSDARVFWAPNPRGDGRFGWPLYDLDGERLVTTEAAEWIGDTSGDIWLGDSGCTLRVVDEERSWRCPITLSNPTVTVPEGTEDGPFTITGRVTIEVNRNRFELSGSLEAMIGTVKEVDTITLGLATDTKGTGATGDDTIYPSFIERGGKTRLRLQILNENGKSAAKGSISSVAVTTTLGGLSSLVENGACSGGSGRTICVIPTTALTGENTDELLVELAHTGTAGTATVWANVLDSEGERQSSNQVTIDVAGPPAALAIAQPATALLGYDPSEATDQRNRAALVVSATDKDGNRASVPTTRYSAKLSGPDGKAVALSGAGAKAQVEWPLRRGDDLVLNGGNPQARVTIAAAAAAPLAAGEYTLELGAGSGTGRLTATQTFNVALSAAAVALSVEPAGEIGEGESLTFTAMVTDASGAAVPDGTPVDFSEQSTSPNAVLVLLSPSRQLTSGGEASVTVRAIGVGSAYVRAEADSEAAIRSITVAPPPPPSLDAAAAGLAIDSYSIWTGPRATMASELYALLEGVSQISKWDGVSWVSYGETDGQLNSGSIDFSIQRGTVLWLSGK